MTTPQTGPRLKRRNYGRGHGYLIDGEKVTGVTTAIGVLDKPALRDWYARQAAERAVNEWDDLAKLPPMERYERIRYGARDRVRDAALRGTEIHALGHKLAEGGEVDVPAEHRVTVEAYARWLDKWDVHPIAAETPLCSFTHQYGGTADLWATIGKLDDAPALLDVKTGSGVYDETALQLAAYRHSEVIQVGGEEIPTPEVAHVFVAHVKPDDVRMVPVLAGPDEFRSFLYVLHLARTRKSWEDWPLIGAAIQPGDPAEG